ncbi:MAG: L-threonylcarbamoyladenylate synthase type 1 TsaC, partial [Treponema sp.]|nr:L-threonylcarbamoyladenylate synthase type 1 TsaC [Treponema sp.]
LPEISGGEGEAFLFFDGTARNAWQAGKHSIHAIIKTLSDGGNLLEAAANLFEYLHELDNSGVTRIYAQRAPDIGLGVAINDRLERAGYKVKGIK